MDTIFRCPLRLVAVEMVLSERVFPFIQIYQKEVKVIDVASLSIQGTVWLWGICWLILPNVSACSSFVSRKVLSQLKNSVSALHREGRHLNCSLSCRSTQGLWTAPCNRHTVCAYWLMWRFQGDQASTEPTVKTRPRDTSYVLNCPFLIRLSFILWWCGLSSELNKW